MWTQPRTRPRRVLRLRLTLLDVARPVERLVEVGAESRLESLHGLITAVFAWSGEPGHRFTDRRSTARYEPWIASGQRVWEMEHFCRDRGHVSDCEWTATVGAVLDPRANGTRAAALFYELGVDSRCPTYEYGSGCLVADLGTCDAEVDHGWTVGIEVLEDRKAGRGELVPALLDGRGRSPLQETGGTAGDAALSAVLDDPMHPRHAELEQWARELIGPWATAGARAYNPDQFDPIVVAQALDLRPQALEATLPDRVVGAAAGIPRRLRFDVLTAAARLGLQRDAPFDPEAAARLTGEIAGWLRQIGRAEPSDDLSTVDTVFVRSLKLIWRRQGEWRVTRLGERVMTDPVALLAQCAEGFWNAAGHPAIGLHVLLGVANGMAGEPLIAHVMAARTADRATPPDRNDEWDVSTGWPGASHMGDAELGNIVDCTSFLARFGAFTADTEHPAVTADGYALAATFLTR